MNNRFVVSMEPKEFRFESLGTVKANHPCFEECLELDEVMTLRLGQKGYFRFKKCGQPKHILVIRVK